MKKGTEQYFDLPVAEVIKSRHSVRTYKAEGLSKELKAKLLDYARDIEGPFDAKVRLELIDDMDIAEKAGGKIGTYGIIKGAKAYIAGIVSEGDKSLEQLGYTLEKLILFATSLGLGTCWLGGTFKKSEFAKLVNLQQNESLPIVTPVGYPEKKRSLVESLMRVGAGSDKRKPWQELFFEGSFQKPLSEENAGLYAEMLEMLRFAPSASNKQPWRVLKERNSYHFYLKSAKGYGSALGFNIQRIDMGIAMCHFEMTAREMNLQGSWLLQTDRPQVPDLEYIVSWIEE